MISEVFSNLNDFYDSIKAVSSPASSGVAAPAQSLLHQHCSHIPCCIQLCRREGNQNFMEMVKSCHLFTFALTMEIFIKGCPSLFPFALIKASRAGFGQGKPSFTPKQCGGFELSG